MSIPGLGQIPDDDETQTTRTLTLPAFTTLSITTSTTNPIHIRLQSGTAERCGTELAPAHLYTLLAQHTAITTFTGCTLEIDGTLTAESQKTYPSLAAHPYNALLNLHYKLSSLRDRSKRDGSLGPRLMIVGSRTTGKTDAIRTLAAYAARAEDQPLVVNLSPNEGMLSVPGTLSASVFASVMDIETPGGWGSSPSSGPSALPVKVPLVFYYGHDSPAKDVRMYREMVSGVATYATARLRADRDVGSAGLLIDTSSVSSDDKAGIESLTHIADEFSVNLILSVSHDPALSNALSTHYANSKTSLGDPITVIHLPVTEGPAPPPPESWISQAHQADIKHYFFGDSNQTLSPFTQQVDISALTIYQIPENPATASAPLEPLPLTPALEQWTLTIMNASIHDHPETVRKAPVLGFVYVAHVDSEKNKAKILAPVAGRLGDHPMVWGRWPEPNVNLLG